MKHASSPSVTHLRRLQILPVVAIAIHRMVFSGHNPAKVAELDYAVSGTDAAVDRATLLLTSFR